jgi:hypothetical protein
MFVPNPSATTASQPQPSDIAQLVGLLSNLMPLLLRFQSQALEQPFQAGPGNVATPNPTLDQQAAENFIADIIAGSLRTLSAYLEANAGRHAGLESCVPMVTQAAHRFAARDYAEAFNLIWLAYRAIEMIRATDPQIPRLRAGGWTSADQTSSSIH